MTHHRKTGKIEEKSEGSTHHRMSLPRVCVLGFNNDVGGTRTAYREFLSMLLESGFPVAAISISDESQWVPDGLLSHIRIPFTRSKLGVKKVFSTQVAAKQARSFGPDVFVSIGLGRTGNMIAQRLKQTSYTICQDVIFGRHPLDDVLVEASRHFHAIAPQAPSMEMRLRRDGFSASKLRWLPCFPRRFDGSHLANPRTCCPFRVGYFGRIAPHKGLDLLIEAYAEEELVGTMVIDIWGLGQTDIHMRRVQDLGLGDSIRFMGAYPTGETGTELLASYDCLTLTSRDNEGLPLILIEAMSCGLPLMVTNVAAIPDCCNNNPDAVMVTPSISGIRSGVREIVDRLEKGMFSSSRQRAFFDAHFSHAVMKQRWINCLIDPAGFFNR